jgi:hypothetical protein
MSRDRSTRNVAARADWLAIFDAYGVQFLVLDAVQDGDLLHLVRSRPGWAVDFQDKDGVLLARSQPIPESGRA